MAGTAVINRYPIAAGPLPVAGTVTVASDGGSTVTPVSVGFKPSLVILMIDSAAGTDTMYIWTPAMSSGYYSVAAAAAGATTGGYVSHYNGTDEVSSGFTIAAAAHANSDVIHFIAFP